LSSGYLKYFKRNKNVSFYIDLCSFLFYIAFMKQGDEL